VHFEKGFELDFIEYVWLTREARAYGKLMIER